MPALGKLRQEDCKFKASLGDPASKNIEQRQTTRTAPSTHNNQQNKTKSKQVYNI
jgi:hypothetical protein